MSKIWRNAGFLWLLFSRTRPESTILFLYGKIRVRENPYFCISYAGSVMKASLRVTITFFQAKWKSLENKFLRRVFSTLSIIYDNVLLWKLLAAFSRELFS